jgi:hypothetical protein
VRCCLLLHLKWRVVRKLLSAQAVRYITWNERYERDRELKYARCCLLLPKEWRVVGELLSAQAVGRYIRWNAKYEQ